MRKVLKGVAFVVLGLVVLAGAGVLWLVLRKPASRPPQTAAIEVTPARLARGKYVVEHLADCVGCHSDRAWDRYGGPIVEGGLGAGGFVFDAKVGIPGVLAAQNITPDKETGIGAWTDGEILRAMREGVGREGNALFPMMPYVAYRNMSDEDAASAVVYLRSIAPVSRKVPPSRIDFPVSGFIKGVPRPLDRPVETPDDAKDHLGYGKYVATLGGCLECHTPRDGKNRPIEARRNAGGWKFTGPWGIVVASNITPHPSTWFGKATKEQFIARFKSFASFDEKTAPAVKDGENTPMPWLATAGETEQDLGALYDYLKTIPPLESATQ